MNEERGSDGRQSPTLLLTYPPSASGGLRPPPYLLTPHPYHPLDLRNPRKNETQRWLLPHFVWVSAPPAKGLALAPAPRRLEGGRERRPGLRLVCRRLLKSPPTPLNRRTQHAFTYTGTAACLPRAPRPTGVERCKVQGVVRAAALFYPRARMSRGKVMERWRMVRKPPDPAAAGAAGRGSTCRERVTWDAGS